MSTTGTLINWVVQQFCDNLGVPLAGGFVAVKVAGENTDKTTYAQADLDPTSANSNPVELDSGGRPPVAIFFGPGLADVTVYDADMVQVWTALGVGVPEENATTGFGTLMTQGARNVTANYEVLATDLFITVSASPGGDPCPIQLPPVSTRTQPICVKNLSTSVVRLDVDGGDTIDGSLSSWQINASGTPNFATAWLFPDGNSGWWIFANKG